VRYFEAAATSDSGSPAGAAPADNLCNIITYGWAGKKPPDSGRFRVWPRLSSGIKLRRERAPVTRLAHIASGWIACLRPTRPDSFGLYLHFSQ
jgi:hypothetical protein